MQPDSRPCSPPVGNAAYVYYRHHCNVHGDVLDICPTSKSLIFPCSPQYNPMDTAAHSWTGITIHVLVLRLYMYSMCVFHIWDLKTGQCITILLSPVWKALPGKLHKLLSKWMRCVVQKRSHWILLAGYALTAMPHLTTKQWLTDFTLTASGCERFKWTLHIRMGETVPSTWSS